MSELVCQTYAVGHEAEGICLLLQIGPYRILLDCGLMPLPPALTRPVENTAIDFVICSNARSDQARGLLALHQRYPALPIYASEVTAHLLPLNWLDQDVSRFCQGIAWQQPFQLAANLSVELLPAGSLPGAACVLLRYETSQKTYQVVYASDCFISNTRLVAGLPMDALRSGKSALSQPDVLIIGGRYGARRQLHRRQQENAVTVLLRQVIEDAKVPDRPARCIVIPSPILGLGQELLLLLRSHYSFTGYPISIWIDPVIGAGCDAYLELLSTFPSNVQNFAQHQSIFWDDRVLPHVKRLQVTEANLPIPAPAIFIVHPSTPLELYCHRHTGEWTVLLSDTAELNRWQAEVIGTQEYD